MAKRIFTLFCIISGTVLFFGFLTVGTSANGNCEKNISKLMDFYMENFMSEKVYLKFSSYEVSNNLQSSVLMSEIWKEGSRYRYDNPFMSVFQDDKNQVTVLKDRKLIVIRSVKSGTGSNFDVWKNISLSSQMDTLKKYTSGIECKENEGRGQVIFRFARKGNEKNYMYKRVVLEYVLKTGVPSKGEYEYLVPTGEKKQVFEYHAFSKKFNSAILKEEAVSQVMAGTMLKDKYSAYTIKDMRNHPAH